MFLLFFTILTTCLSYKINSHRQHYNIFTIQQYNETLEQIKNYSYDDIEKYRLDINHHINMYSLFTKSYFERCHNYNDPNCNYSIEEQEMACNKYMVDLPNHYDYPHNAIITRNLYYYGTYNNPILNFVIKSDGTVFRLNKHDTIYETTGMYIIEDVTYSDDYIETDSSSCNFKLHTYDDEPYDFHRKMMLYVVEYQNRTVFCPYWEIKKDYILF
jgi:hypothetical protein